ncbi:MAG: hypothetical protein ACT4P1_16850, partial [Sporichthyaceae bacterium]
AAAATAVPFLGTANGGKSVLRQGLKGLGKLFGRGGTNAAETGAARTFSNLAPADAIRPFGVQFVNPSALKGVSGRYNYVVAENGGLLLGNRRYGHIDLSGGANVRAAGEVRIVNGEVRSINNASGHYRPSGPEAQSAAEQAFGSAGLVVPRGAYTEIPR